MRFYVRDHIMREKAKREFIRDCNRIKRGLPPRRVLETDIYITKRCNINCSYCYFREYFKNPDQSIRKDPTLNSLKKLLEKIEGKTYCLVILGGEPFSRTDFKEFLKYAREKDIYSIRVTTNGLYLKQNKTALPLIDRLNVSFDYTRIEEYPEKMKKLLRDITEVKEELGDSFPRLCLAWTTGAYDNFTDHVRPLLDYAIENKFEVKFLPVKIDQRADWIRHKDIVLQAIKYSSPEVITNDLDHTRKLDSKFVFKNCLQNIQYYIDYDGQFLYPCDEFPNQKVGSVYEYTLNQLYEAGIKKFGVYPKKNPICSQCPSGCHSDNSQIFLNPGRQVSELV